MNDTEFRLTPFEHYMFADDCSVNPARFCFRVGFEGRLDSEQWQRAFEKAGEEHVLLTAKVKRRLGRWLWSLERDTLAVVPNKDETSPSSWDFDLSRETGVRF
ncbi:MAG: hypothetical protein ACI87E_002232, partial [Mariniblastus sp.]